MSYILDALRKADAQRQRTRLPGLHAQATAAPVDAAPAPWWRSPIGWVLVAALVVLAVVLAWPASPPPVAVPVAAAPSSTGIAPVERPVQAPPAPLASATPVAPAPAAAIQPAPPPAPQVVMPQGPAAPARHAPVHAFRSTPDRVDASPAPEPSAPAPGAAVTARPPSSRTTTAAAPAAVPAPAEASTAPPGAPKLAITGGVYSANAAQRLLIVGGQVFNEGSEVAPGVVLEQVRPNQALLSFRGQRYTVRY